MRILFCIIFSFALISGSAQDLGQVIRGKISNSTGGGPVKNASVSISGENNYSTTTDTSGNYETVVKPGTYTITVTAPGFRPLQTSSVTVLAGKQQVQDIGISPSNIELQTVIVGADKKSGTVNIDMEQMQRFAAVFYDPARVITAHAGAINTDDQANNISVHGASPSYNQWTLEGVEIVNPNHLENAGTVNDRPSMNGGGVCILSAQLLKNSSFKLSPTEASDVNAVAGTFNMDLRNGNESKNEHTIQASLLGIDLATEGPFSRNKRASYLVNARYSTVGLLSKMGIDFGDERITYGDVSWKMNFPYKRGAISTFGFAGQSTTDFSGKEKIDDIKTEKDLFNIDYTSFTFAGGISSLLRLRENLSLKNVVVYSSKDVSRTADPLSVMPSGLKTETDGRKQQKLSSVHYLSTMIGSRVFLKFGSYVNLFDNDISVGLNDSTVHSSLQELLVLPFVSADITFSRAISLNIGINGFLQTRISYFGLQPSAELKYIAGNNNSFSLRYARGEQLQAAPLYISSQNRYLQPTHSDSYGLSHRFSKEHLEVLTELYYNQFSNIPVDQYTGFSAYNYLNEFVPYKLTQDGRASVYGADESIHLKKSSFYSIISAGIFKSIYEINGKERESRFNSGYNASLTTGKEFHVKKGRMGIDLHGTVRNGFKELMFLNSSEDMTYAVQLPVYYRIDLRLSYTKERSKRTAIWAIDIQNLTNRKNVSYHYYDEVTGHIETRYQLGIIPVLSYKVLF
ncbi:MAG: carboxypeptidase regulatory-like domain-containing protein [Bacteroidia bacterium]